MGHVAHVATGAKRRAVRPGEALAIDAKGLRQGPDALEFILWPTPVAVNEVAGDTCIVHVRGPLEHHAEEWADSYDAIRQRVAMALAEDVSAVVLRIDSPGGVVSGLNETVFMLRAMSATADKPLIAFVDEMAASAAYALCCACSEVYLPPSAITGSIGTISTMASQARADEKAGIDFVTIASGARKADGHVHMPISDAAIAAEQRRVDALAQQFFKLVSGARPGLSAKDIEAFQAKLFLGKEAVRALVADDVLSWDGLMARLSDSATAAPVNKKALAKPVTTGSTLAQHGTAQRGARQEDDPMTLQALIRKTEAKLKAETDPKKRASLTANLAAFRTSLKAMTVPMAGFKKTEKHVEHTKTEEADDEEEEEAEESESEEEEEEEAAAKGNETNRKEGDDGDEPDDDDKEDDDDDEESSKKGAKKAASALGSLRKLAASAGGPQRDAMLGTLQAFEDQGKQLASIAAEHAAMKRARRAQEREALVTEALAGKYKGKHVGGPRVSKADAKWLRSQTLAVVSSYLENRRTAVVFTEEGDIRVPADAGASSAGGFTSEQMRMFEEASQASGGKLTVEALIKNYRERQAALNGAAEGRY